MLDLIAPIRSSQSRLDGSANGGARKLDPKLLKPPIERPSKIWAAAGNYKRGTGGLDDARGRGTASENFAGRAAGKYFFQAAFSHRRPGREHHRSRKTPTRFFPSWSFAWSSASKSRNVQQSASYGCDFRLHHHARRDRPRLRS